jgi:hypothetical protein
VEQHERRIGLDAVSQRQSLRLGLFSDVHALNQPGADRVAPTLSDRPPDPDEVDQAIGISCSRRGDRKEESEQHFSGHRNRTQPGRSSRSGRAGADTELIAAVS